MRNAVWLYTPSVRKFDRVKSFIIFTFFAATFLHFCFSFFIIYYHTDYFGTKRSKEKPADSISVRTRSRSSCPRSTFELNLVSFFDVQSHR